MIRLLSVTLLAAVTACSNSPDVRGSGNGNGDAGLDDDDGTSGDGPNSDVDPLVSDSIEECEPTTCEDLGVDCGPASDGCGGVVECGQCESGSLCGILERNLCTRLSDLCIPQSKSEACAGKECGTEGDGCGGTHECGDCESGEACGLDEPFTCGTVPESDDDDCDAKIDSCEAAGAECGRIGNGCGGLLDCDEQTGGCDGGEHCGFGGPNLCGNLPDCVPLTESEACDGKECGVVSDGCGGTHDCGDCATGELCGLDEPFQCDEFVGDCRPVSRDAACQDRECGVVYDGCGSAAQNQIDCGQCADGEFCGLYEPFECGAPAPANCTPASSCADLGWECGQAIDSCGNIFDCASEGRICEPDRGKKKRKEKKVKKKK